MKLVLALSLLPGLVLTQFGCDSGTGEDRDAAAARSEPPPAKAGDTAPGDGVAAQTTTEEQDEVKLRILVTNDDGVLGRGLNELVTSLLLNPNNEVIVAAPLTNKSGTGDKTGCGTSRVFESVSHSPHTWAIDGCPADAVNYALDNLFSPEAPPHVVLSGINKGQNIAKLYDCGLASEHSGTIGAAKTAARRGIPALAASQGLGRSGCPVDFQAGAREVIAWLDDNRDELLTGEGSPGSAVTAAPVYSLNIPTCCDGSVLKAEGQRLAVEFSTQEDDMCKLLMPQDCAAGVTDPAAYKYDVEAFLDGWVTLSEVPTDGSTTECRDGRLEELRGCIRRGASDRARQRHTKARG